MRRCSGPGGGGSAGVSGSNGSSACRSGPPVMLLLARVTRTRSTLPVRFTYAEAMTDATYYLPLAQAAERAGYTSITVADSLIYPRESDSTYPYTDDGNREFLEDKEFIETFTLIAAMGAVTSTLRFTPFVLKLPVRPPVLVAKQASSIAYLTGNRLGLGVGISPWPEDLAALRVSRE